MTTSPLTSPDASDVDPRVERTRAAVVAASAGLLLDEGPDAITHGRVAAAADVSRTTVYKHYPERADLLRATVAEIGKQAPDPAEFTGDIRTDLRAVLELLADDLRDEGRTKLMATMIERAQHDDTVAEVRDAVFAEFRDAFRSLVSGAIAAGHIRADADADRVLASLAGALLFSKMLANQPIDDAFVDQIVDDFLTTNATR